jgi:uncharacterized protein (DUF433 family)
MEPTLSFNVNDLPAVQRQALEGMLGRPLSPDQRVMITAYTPDTVSRDSWEDPRGMLQGADQYVLEHGILPKEADAAIEESLEQFHSDSMSGMVDARGRIVGTRITVYDVLTYASNRRHPSSIGEALGVSTAQVQAALHYFTENREDVLKNYRVALARIARGNPPEVEAKLRQSHERMKERLREIRQRRGA